MELLPWLSDSMSGLMDILFGLRVSIGTLVDKWLVGSSSLRRLKLMKGSLHEGVQDIESGRMS